jgi:hypothetical protein
MSLPVVGSLVTGHGHQRATPVHLDRGLVSEPGLGGTEPPVWCVLSDLDMPRVEQLASLDFHIDQIFQIDLGAGRRVALSASTKATRFHTAPKHATIECLAIERDAQKANATPSTTVSTA